MRTRWLPLTLLMCAGGCDLGVDLDGLGGGFSCTGCWTVGGGRSGSGGTPYPTGSRESYRGIVRVAGVPVWAVDQTPPKRQTFARVTLFGERSADGGCDYAPSSLPGLDTMCIYATTQTDVTGRYRIALGGSQAIALAAFITRGTASIAAELWESGTPDDSFAARPLGQWQVKSITSPPDTIVTTDFDFPGPN